MNDEKESRMMADQAPPEQQLPHATPKNATVRNALRALPWILFAMFAFRELELPGAYMDEMNAGAFAPAILDSRAADKPHFRLPDNILGNQARFPVVGGSVYNAEVASYVAAPLYKFWGFSLLTQRLWEIIACGTLLLLFQLLALRLFTSPLLLSAIASSLAVDPLFTFPVRANAMGFVLMLIGIFGVLLILESCWRKQRVTTAAAVAVGACTGLAILSYWIAAPVVFVPFLAVAYLARRSNRLWVLLLTTAICLSPYPYAVISIYLQAPSQLAHWGMPQFAVNAQRAAPVSLPVKVASAVQEYFNYFASARPLFFTGASMLVGTLARAVIFVGAILFMFGDLIWRCRKGTPDKSNALLSLMIVGGPLVGFWILLTVFASITYHHMLSTLPFAYLALGYVCDRSIALLPQISVRARSSAAVAVPVLVLLISVCQQQQVVSALRRTGGIGFFNERIGEIPLLASQLFPNAFVVFPDWGFHLPFLYLTAGKVPYAAASGEPRSWMTRVLAQQRNIVLCVTAARTELIAASAREAGATVVVRPVNGRDGRLIFNFVHARLPAPGASAPPSPAPPGT